MKWAITDIEREDIHRLVRPRPADGHKGTFGHALLVCGSPGMAGAAMLAAEACLRSGVGKLSVLTDEANRLPLQIAVPEAVLTSDPIPQARYEAVGIGPGMGRQFDTLHTLLQHVHTPMVIDADALNMLAERPDWEALIPEGSILTPHPLEAERLTGSRELDVVADFAVTHQAYIILKGHPTHVCTPEGDILRLRVGNSGMATAGSGDVLTGLITGLLAQGYPPRSAALMGVWLHGSAGDISSDEMGENCTLARDIIRHLPGAFKRLEIEDWRLKIED